MGDPGLPGGAAVNATAGSAPRAILIQTGPLGPEERSVTAAVARRLAAAGQEVVLVLLGSASYDAEDVSLLSARGATPACWVVDDDARGRGLRLPPEGTVRVVTAAELVEGLMAAERVIQLP